MLSAKPLGENMARPTNETVIKSFLEAKRDELEDELEFVNKLLRRAAGEGE